MPVSLAFAKLTGPLRTNLEVEIHLATPYTASIISIVRTLICCAGPTIAQFCFNIFGNNIFAAKGPASGAIQPQAITSVANPASMLLVIVVSAIKVEGTRIIQIGPLVAYLECCSIVLIICVGTAVIRPQIQIWSKVLLHADRKHTIAILPDGRPIKNPTWMS